MAKQSGITAPSQTMSNISAGTGVARDIVGIGTGLADMFGAFGGDKLDELGQAQAQSIREATRRANIRSGFGEELYGSRAAQVLDPLVTRGTESADYINELIRGRPLPKTLQQATGGVRDLAQEILETRRAGMRPQRFSEIERVTSEVPGGALRTQAAGNLQRGFAQTDAEVADALLLKLLGEERAFQETSLRDMLARIQGSGAGVQAEGAGRTALINALIQSAGLV